MSDPDLAIGQVAGACGATVSAVRYYADLGLLPVSRRVGGKRRFAPTAIARVGFIRRCRSAGFTLDEINGILDDDPGRWRAAVDAKVIELAEQRRHLDETIALLTEIRSCDCTVVDECEALSHGA